jgi:hypothetical protein
MNGLMKMNNISNLVRERVKSYIEYGVNRKELWLKECSNILYPDVSFLDLRKQIYKDNLTLYKSTDKIEEYHLAYSYDFVEEKYLDYIANFNVKGYTLPTYKNESLIKQRKCYG